MKQRRIVPVLAIIAVTGAVSLSNSLAVAWRLDVSDRSVVDRGGLTWNHLIHRVTDINDPSRESWPQNENYGRYSDQLRGLREDGASQRERSGYGMEDKSRSAGQEPQVYTQPQGNYFRSDQSSAYPTTPNADPSVGELSRELSPR
jgi:hypothetical protein